jgi:hypothetical protein
LRAEPDNAGLFVMGHLAAARIEHEAAMQEFLIDPIAAEILELPYGRVGPLDRIQAPEGLFQLGFPFPDIQHGSLHDAGDGQEFLFDAPIVSRAQPAQDAVCPAFLRHAALAQVVPVEDAAGPVGKRQPRHYLVLLVGVAAPEPGDAGDVDRPAGIVDLEPDLRRDVALPCLRIVDL